MPAALEQYLDELYRWNRRINLTSIPREQAQSRHIDETRQLLAIAEPAAGASVVDLGSGGGIPGLVIAIIRPDLQLTLIEADRRKAAFLTHAAANCGCANVVVVAARAEEVGRDPDHRERHDILYSRATAAMPTLCELALPLLRIGGRMLALVADADLDSRRAAPAAAACGGAAPRALSAGIVEVSKVAATPDVYPRRAGIPAKHPLV